MIMSVTTVIQAAVYVDVDIADADVDVDIAVGLDLDLLTGLLRPVSYMHACTRT